MTMKLLLLIAVCIVCYNEAKVCTLFGNKVCACYNNKHCSAGSGCLVSSCTQDSCGFPRICFCQENGNGTSNCAPVNSGPCDDCPASAVAETDGEFAHTPMTVLREEFDRLSDFELEERVGKLSLSTDGGRTALIARLITYSIAEEKRLHLEKSIQN
eukprot:TRINITY_DN1168_c0_g3_i1.p1 TRINITY_DN1168_c0_g3~~TRINITY_DN1168_c0_g3_i1.p1  ORF type:complete len:157 (-),score=13.89 TRINITY_DN1168_c0_g3_i1:74-544(-)